MPFTLTVTNLAGKRPEFAFDTDEARLGRTADNDVVVKDKNASRSHCRVFVEDGQHWLEDLMSQNGTLLNGARLQGAKRELKDGDTISIGDISFVFTVQARPSAELPVPEPGLEDTVVRGGPGSSQDTDGAKAVRTELRPSLELSVPQGPPTDLIPGALPAHVDRTDEREVAPAPAPSALAPQPSATLEDPLPAPEPAPLPAAQPPEAERVRVRRGRDRGQEGDSELLEPTAADKARVRRAAYRSTGGRLLYEWGQLTLKVRVLAAAVAFAAVFALGAYVTSQVVGPPRAQLLPEPAELVAQGPTVEASFGYGPGVTYERADLKLFTFKAVSPTPLVGLLHFQAKDVGKDEVAISLNGHDLGFVPPDALDSADRELEVVLPATQVKRNEPNQLQFDDVKNPPGKDPWRVWNLWLQLLPVPDTGRDETLLLVKEDLERGQKFYEQREIGAETLFKSWKSYRDAWLKLESLPGRPNDLYGVARTQQAETWKLLNHRCRMKSMEVQRVLTAKDPNYDTAREILRDTLRYFPTKEHPCHALVQEQLEQLAR